MGSNGESVANHYPLAVIMAQLLMLQMCIY